MTTYYLYAGGALLCEINSAGSITRSYNWGRLGLISDTTGSQSRFYLWDALGNLRTLLSPTGTVQWQRDWSAYGSPVCPTAPNTPFAWKGRGGAYTDSESNFLRMGARYYAPNLARFLTRDPSGYSAGPNLYAFCGCDPLDFFDPTGCGPEEGEGWLWHGNRELANRIDGMNAQVHSLSLGLGPSLPNPFAALGNAHDAMYDFGYAAGNSKASASEVRQKAGRAALTFGIAVLEIYMTGKALCGTVDASGPGGCFVAGVPVWMVSEEGSWSSGVKPRERNGKPRLFVKPVEEVKRGDLAASRNPQTGKLEAKRVLRRTVRTVSVVVSVGLAEGKSGRVVDTATATREHPFYVRGKGFVPAGGLAIGNAIVTRAGPDLVVKSLTWHRRAEGYKVYNFVVEDDHSYFVGLHNGGTWVHNPANYQPSLFPPSPPPMDLDGAVQALHSHLTGYGQSVSTTGMGAALAPDGTLLTIVSSSDDIVPAVIRRNMEPGWLTANGIGHAEPTFLQYCTDNGLTPLTVAASRPICPDCAIKIFQAGAVPISPVRLW